MNLDYAVDRLYDTGWLPDVDDELELLDDGRRYPTPWSIERLFNAEGLQLVIKHNVVFNCYRATWSPKNGSPTNISPANGSPANGSPANGNPTNGDARAYGTVIGSGEHEAAVYALAQLRSSRASHVQPPAMA